MNHLHEQFGSNISRTRVNGSFRVLCKPRLLFSRINGPIVVTPLWRCQSVTRFFSTNAICSRVTRDVALRTSAWDRRLAASQALCVRSNHPPFALVAHFQYTALRLRSLLILEKPPGRGGKVSAAHTLHSFYAGSQGTSKIVPLRIIK